MRVFNILDSNVDFYTVPTGYLKVGDKVFVQVKDKNNKRIIKEIIVDVILSVDDIPDSEIIL
ncbi:hypothetical protein MHK_002088 [Candidatus Magnetomorum sp. HK-1]|nr:hypothetical protein MHK_002088 [Candidatus Magnetomorum sp. HK-1]